MRVCATRPGARYPAVVWEVYAPETLEGEPSLGYRRSIAAMNDGGRWVFHEAGKRFPFERVGQFSDEFLRVDAYSPAVRLQQITKVWHTPEFTLEQVVAGVPWQSPQHIPPPSRS